VCSTDSKQLTITFQTTQLDIPYLRGGCHL